MKQFLKKWLPWFLIVITSAFYGIVLVNSSIVINCVGEFGFIVIVCAMIFAIFIGICTHSIVYAIKNNTPYINKYYKNRYLKKGENYENTYWKQ